MDSILSDAIDGQRRVDSWQRSHFVQHDIRCREFVYCDGYNESGRGGHTPGAFHVGANQAIWQRWRIPAGLLMPVNGK